MTNDMPSRPSYGPIHSPEEGDRIDATCAECHGKLIHSESCSIGLVEKEAQQMLVQANNSTPTVPQQQ
jgi:hypothetical protein